METATKVWLAQQSVWDLQATGLESMPLACGYLKAAAEADELVARRADLRIFNFGGHDGALSMIRRLLCPEVPDVLACSVYGWNFNTFCRVAETFRDLNPAGLVVLGGPHASGQVERVMRLCPAVDVIVHGEGELTFRDLLRALLQGRDRHALHDLPGLSFRASDGRIVTTQPRERLRDLDDLPSPILSGAVELTRPDGTFRYDVAILETSRGCPNRCGYCHWGGAVGERLATFSPERLEAEIEVLARLGVENLVLCDANFGMTEADEAFVEILIRARQRHGFPRSVITSWTKNKGKPFYRIVERMLQAGLHSSFTLALQTLSPPALEVMGRRNMTDQAWQALVSWLRERGLNVYGELMWGCPGESYDSFLEGYDRLSEHVSNIACYSHLLLPGSGYARRKDALGFVTWRGGKDDFEYVLSHRTMSLDDNLRMHRFLFWARLLGEYTILRHVWAPLRRLAGVRQSEVIRSLDAWLDGEPDSVAAGLRACRAKVVEALDAYAIEPGLRFFYEADGLHELLTRWWEEAVVPIVPAELAGFFRALFQYDWATRPIYAGRQGEPIQVAGPLRVERHGGVDYYVARRAFSHDVPAALACLFQGEPVEPAPSPITVTLYFKVGFQDFITNHEFNQQFTAKTLEELPGPCRPGLQASGPPGPPAPIPAVAVAQSA